MGKLFVIMGKSATGKDSLYQRIVEDFPKLQEVVIYDAPDPCRGDLWQRVFFCQ